MISDSLQYKNIFVLLYFVQDPSALFYIQAQYIKKGSGTLARGNAAQSHQLQPDHEKLILMGTQKPGALGKLLQRPHLARKLIRIVWRKEMGTNYTNYSPIASKWTEDLASSLDNEGRQVCFMTKPPDVEHNPKCEYLTHDGLVLLDQNNDPVKYYPGALRTLDNNCPGYLSEGLHRVFGMTYNK